MIGRWCLPADEDEGPEDDKEMCDGEDDGEGG